MEIRQLRYFTAVVEEGTVTGAARRLNMTQPPLTAQLHNLEQELGCCLFEHKGRRLHLTEAGHTLYERACMILGFCDTTAAEMSDFVTGTAGTLRIGVISSVQETLFPKWLCQFAAHYPQVQYDLYSANTYQLLEQLRVGGLDLAVIRTPFSAPDLDIHYLKKEFLVAIGTEKFLQDIPGETVTLEQLAAKPLILYRRWEGILRSRFESIGCFPRIRCCNDDAQTTLLLAQNGLGIGLLPSSALSSSNKTLQIRRFDDPSFSTEIAIACRSRQHLTQAAQLFREFLITHSSLSTFPALPPGSFS